VSVEIDGIFLTQILKTRQVDFNTKHHISSVEKELVPSLGTVDPVNKLLSDEMIMLMTLDTHINDTITGWLTLWASVPPAPPAPEEDLHGVDDSQVCRTCVSRLRTIVCVPCGHCSMYTQCRLSLTEADYQKHKCMECRVPVTLM
jgi:hypothetical protein